MDSETLPSSPDTDGNRYWASFARSSFSKGTNMNAHEGILNGKGPRAGKKAIVKAFKHQIGTEELCDLEISKCTTAVTLAEIFNSKFGAGDSITFSKPLKALVDRVALFNWFSLDRKKLSGNEWVLITKNMKKKFHQWISKRGDPCRHAPDIIQAFVHFCYHHTGGDLVVCGLKGVMDEFGFELNTPTIHSERNHFGECDLGMTGVLKVFENHKCNAICENMLTPKTRHLPVENSQPMDIPLQPTAPYDPCFVCDPSSPMVSYPICVAPPPYEPYPPTFTFPQPWNISQENCFQWTNANMVYK